MKVGQKVVCINAEAGWLSGVSKLVKDEIYTILHENGRDIQVIPNDSSWDKSRFRLIETEWVDELLAKITKSENIKIPMPCT